jgi:hypothetical protein
MQNARQLASPVGIATLLVSCSAAGLLAISFKISPALAASRQEVIAAIAVILPIGASTWWIFRKLKRLGFSQREARSVSIAYAASSPFWLVLALVPGEISGSIAEPFLGRIFILPSVFIGTVFVEAILSFATCAFVLWLIRRGDELSPEESLDS